MSDLVQPENFSMTQPLTPPPPPPAPVKKKSALSGPLLFLIGFDVILVVIAIMVGINTFGSPKTPGPTASSQSQSTLSEESQTPAPSESAPAPETSETSAEPDEEETADEELTGVQMFASPTGNISCEISALGARCTIADLAQKPQANVGGCEGVIGQVVILSAQGTELPCVAEQDGPNQAPSDYRKLEYGQDLWVNNYRCQSESDGVTCTDNTTNRGFSLARAGIKTF